MFRKMKHAIDILEEHEALLRGHVASKRHESLVRYLTFEQQKAARAQVVEFEAVLGDIQMALGVLRESPLCDFET